MSDEEYYYEDGDYLDLDDEPVVEAVCWADLHSASTRTLRLNYLLGLFSRTLYALSRLGLSSFI